MDGLIIAPCHNESESLKKFNDILLDNLKKINSNFEILYLNDGSTDDTQDVIYEICKKNRKINYINFKKNYGKNKILFYTLRYSLDFDFVILIDSDLQHDPIYIKDLVNKFKEGKHDTVIGLRESYKETKVVKFLKKIYFFFCGLSVDQEHFSDYRLISSKIIKKVVNINIYPPFMRHFLDSLSFRKGFISIDIRDREYGTSNFNVFKLIILGLKSIIYLKFNKKKIISLIFFNLLILIITFFANNIFYYIASTIISIISFYLIAIKILFFKKEIFFYQSSFKKQ